MNDILLYLMFKPNPKLYIHSNITDQVIKVSQQHHYINIYCKFYKIRTITFPATAQLTNSRYQQAPANLLQYWASITQPADHHQQYELLFSHL